MRQSAKERLQQEASHRLLNNYLFESINMSAVLDKEETNFNWNVSSEQIKLGIRKIYR